MKSLSIIIPIYNQEKYLEDCLLSVMNQDLENYEVILIDDGSVDFSKEICQKYIEKSSIFQYYYQKNQGLGSARNLGLQYALGKYVMFVDSDDLIREFCLKTLISYMEKEQLDILYLDEMLCKDDMTVIGVSPTFPQMKVELCKVDALKYSMQPSHICSRIYRKELFQEIRFERMWYEDMYTFPKIVCTAKKIGYYKIPVYYYRQNISAITHNEIDNRNLDVMKAWESALVMQGLNENEKDAVLYSVLSSIATFIFFKEQYAMDYIHWYNAHLVSANVKQSLQTMYSEQKIVQNYPLLQQAQLLKDKELVDNLKKVEVAYLNGGKVCFKEYQDENSDVMSSCLVIGLKEKISLCAVNVVARSSVLYDIIQELRVQNMISIRGQEKENLLEKIVIKHFILHQYPIVIMEE